MKFKLKKSKVKKKKAEINLSARYLYIISWIVMIGVISYLGFFLYRNFYQTVAQTDEIILLKQEVAPDTINAERIDDVIDKLNNKTSSTSTPNYSDTKNPFEISSSAAETDPESEENEEITE